MQAGDLLQRHTLGSTVPDTLRPDTVQSATDAILELPAGTRFMVTFPLPAQLRPLFFTPMAREVYALFFDADNDGDLDLIINNVNQPAFIYRNEANNKLGNRYLKVKLKGAGKNTDGLGARVYIYYKGNQQLLELDVDVLIPAAMEIAPSTRSSISWK